LRARARELKSACQNSTTPNFRDGPQPQMLGVPQMSSSVTTLPIGVQGQLVQRVLRLRLMV